ncbi:MAG: pseudouridine synthase, partial [Pontibacterium sp.]
HRLDKVTSGALVLAKTSLAASKLSQSFQHRTVRKCYIAISDKKPKKKQGLIKGDMVKSRRGAWRLSQTMNAPAQTRFTSYAYQPGLRVFFVRPITGKTHQIRVALKSISAPIIGDKYYHETVQPAPDRTYLHAYWLSFRYDGQDYEVIAPPRQGRLFDQAFCQWLCDTLPSPSALWD